MGVDKEAKWEGGLKRACPQGHRKNAVLESRKNTIFTKKKVSISSELVWTLNMPSTRKDCLGLETRFQQESLSYRDGVDHIGANLQVEVACLFPSCPDPK